MLDTCVGGVVADDSVAIVHLSCETTDERSHMVKTKRLLFASAGAIAKRS